MSIYCDWRQNHLAITLSGKVDWNQWRHMTDQLSEDPRFDTLRFIVVDLFFFAGSNANPREIRAMAHQIRAMALSNQTVTMAVVQPFEGSSHQQQSVLNVIQQSPWSIRKFLTRRQADQWVYDQRQAHIRQTPLAFTA